MADRISEIRERVASLATWRAWADEAVGRSGYEDLRYLLAELDKLDQRIAELRHQLLMYTILAPHTYETLQKTAQKALDADDEAAKSKEPSHEG